MSLPELQRLLLIRLLEDPGAMAGQLAAHHRRQRRGVTKSLGCLLEAGLVRRDLSEGYIDGRWYLTDDGRARAEFYKAKAAAA